MRWLQSGKRALWLDRALDEIAAGRSVEDALGAIPEPWRETLREEVEAAAWVASRRESLVHLSAGKVHRQLASSVRRPKVARRKTAKRRLRWQWAGAVALVVVVLLSTTATVFAQKAVPGDMLYGAKRLTEAIEIALPLSDAQRVSLLLTFAERRIEEAEIVSARGQSAAAVDLLQEYVREIEQVESIPSDENNVPAGWVERVRRQQQRLERLQGTLSGKAGNAASIAAAAVRDLMHRWDHGKPDAGQGAKHSPPVEQNTTHHDGHQGIDSDPVSVEGTPAPVQEHGSDRDNAGDEEHDQAGDSDNHGQNDKNDNSHNQGNGNDHSQGDTQGNNNGHGGNSENNQGNEHHDRNSKGNNQGKNNKP